MAMKYKGQKGVTALMCGIALLCVIFPVILIVAIPAIVGGIVSLIIKNKKEKEEQLLYNDAITYINNLDICCEKDFEKSLNELIKRAKFFGYKINRCSDDIFIKCYQSIDNIGISVVRKEYGNQITQKQVIITNRYLTPKAKEFCNNAMITVIDRSDLINIYIYIKKSERE